MDLLFHGRRFHWTLLLADVQFPIIGVDFLRHFHLMVEPAANRLVDKRSSQELSTISSIASGIAGVKVPPGSPATTGKAATCGQDVSQDGLLFTSAIPGPEQFRRIVAQFPKVVNLQKSLPAPTTGVDCYERPPCLGEVPAARCREAGRRQGGVPAVGEGGHHQVFRQPLGVRTPHGPET